MTFPSPAERRDWFANQYECSLPTDAKETSQPQEVSDTTEESAS